MEANRTRNRTRRRNPLSDRTNLPSSTVPIKPTTKPNPLALPLSSSSSTSSTVLIKPPTKRANATTIPDAASNPSSPPPPVPSTPVLKSSSIHGTVVLVDHEAASESHTPISITYSRSNKRKGKGKDVAVPESRAPDLNVSSSRKDKGKAVAIPVSRTPDFTVSDHRKDKGKALAIPVSRTPDLKVYNNREGVNLSKAKAWTVPCRKKQRSVPSAEDMFKDPLLQEFIEKQKAYFKAVDEFELPEEEVESDDQLD